MAFPQGINFRETAGYVTDPAGTTYDVTGSAFGNPTYPITTPQGNNVGYETFGSSSVNIRDRDNSNDPRLAGIHFDAGGNVLSYRFDLPAAGDYNIRVAMGDASGSRLADLDLYDTNSSLGSLCSGDTSGANYFKDATNTEYSAAAWPGSNTAVTKTFATTICRFRLNPSGNPDVITWAHLYVEAADTGPPSDIEGDLAATEAKDTFVGLGGRTIEGDLAATEAPDTFAATNIEVDGVSVIGQETLVVSGSSATPGAQSLGFDVPSDAQAVLIFFRAVSNSLTGGLASISSDFTGTIEILDQYHTSGTTPFGGLALAEVTSTGSGKTITPVYDASRFTENSPITLVFLKGIEDLEDFIRDIAVFGTYSTDTLSVNLTTDETDIVIAEDFKYGPLPIPANPAGWTSLLSFSNDSPGNGAGRLRRLDVPTTGTQTITAQNNNYSTLVAVSIKGAATEEEPEDIEGDLASTEAKDTVAAAGKLLAIGNFAATESKDTTAILGNSAVSNGTLAATESKDTAAAAGKLAVSGSLVATEAKDTAALVGKLVSSSVLAATETKDSVAASGLLKISGDLAASEAKDIFASAGGAADIEGTFAVTEAPDTSAISAKVLAAGTLATTEAKDTFSSAGALRLVGTMAVTEAKDSAAAVGTVRLSGTFAATETKDAASALGKLLNSGSLAVTEALDHVTADGDVIVKGNLTVTEAKDGFLALGEDATPQDIEGTLAATESKDTAVIVGKSVVSGSLAVTEAKDSVAIVGKTLLQVVLAITEAKDTALFTGNSALSSGYLSVIEAKDGIAAVGKILFSGVLVVSEARDSLAVNGDVIINGSLIATEAQDTVFITSLIPDPGIELDLIARYSPSRNLRASVKLSVSLIARRD